MKSVLLFSFGLLVLLTSLLTPSVLPVSAAELQQNSSQPAPTVLCLPGIYNYDPGDCIPAGPSAYLTDMAAKGVAFPIPPLSAKPSDPGLAYLDVQYAEVISPNAPVYGSIQEALAGNKKSASQRLNGITVYISYIDEQNIDGKKLYMLDQGAWMRGADISRLGVTPRFQGLLFDSTPTTDFGWVLTFFSPNPQVETKRTPGYQGGDYTGHLLDLYDVVQVFAQEVVEGEVWYMIAPDEWLPKKQVARVIVDSTSPEGVPVDRWIEVNLFDQTLSVYEDGQLQFATVIASGVEPLWTQPGVFQIYEKHNKTPMTGSFEADNSDAYYLEDVPWTMYYDQARALHGAYWRTKMGFEQSHGCINMTPGDAHWLFDWAQLGDWVYVWDPSGLTPTDPAQYGSGGF